MVQPATIRRSLLTEAAIFAVTAIVAGASCGLAVCYHVVADARRRAGYGDDTLAVPWLIPRSCSWL